MSEFKRLREIVARLRAEDGCPWDRAQTHESLKPECIEEAAEVICGINILSETGDAENLKEELGDLLLQVVMHARIAEEEGLFTIDDVCREISEKMIRRHPHVFRSVEENAESGRIINDPDKETLRWDEIKKLEKAGKEWTREYLPGAFDEAEDLINAARKRKGI
ncbi:MAG TPA: tetrapyrrole methylase [Lachnospiraceae bacterium]|nr:tetrapyrrole methylase [Lachnospiraceae bacterium]